jgi:hypothetical protein
MLVPHPATLHPPVVSDDDLGRDAPIHVNIGQGRELVLCAHDIVELTQALRAAARHFDDPTPGVVEASTVGLAPHVGPDGFLRLGRWLLQLRGSSLTLFHRLPHSGRSGLAYSATLVRTDDGWRVARLEAERIRYLPE